MRDYLVFSVFCLILVCIGLVLGTIINEMQMLRNTCEAMGFEGITRIDGVLMCRSGLFFVPARETLMESLPIYEIPER